MGSAKIDSYKGVNMKGNWSQNRTIAVCTVVIIFGLIIASVFRSSADDEQTKAAKKRAALISQYDSARNQLLPAFKAIEAYSIDTSSFENHVHSRSTQLKAVTAALLECDLNPAGHPAIWKAEIQKEGGMAGDGKNISSSSRTLVGENVSLILPYTETRHELLKDEIIKDAYEAIREKNNEIVEQFERIELGPNRFFKLDSQVHRRQPDGTSKGSRKVIWGIAAPVPGREDQFKDFRYSKYYPDFVSVPIHFNEKDEPDYSDLRNMAYDISNGLESSGVILVWSDKIW